MDALEKITGLNNVVAIAGDSWSMGEWFPFKDGDLYAGWVPALSHRSPEIYLHQAYDNLRIYHLLSLSKMPRPSPRKRHVTTLKTKQSLPASRIRRRLTSRSLRVILANSPARLSPS